MFVKLFLKGETRESFREWLGWLARLSIARAHKDEYSFLPKFSFESRDSTAGAFGFFRVKCAVMLRPLNGGPVSIRWETRNGEPVFRVDSYPVTLDLGPSTGDGIALTAECTDADFQDFYFWLLEALAENRPEVKKQLIQQGIELNGRDEQRWPEAEPYPKDLIDKLSEWLVDDLVKVITPPTEFAGSTQRPSGMARDTEGQRTRRIPWNADTPKKVARAFLIKDCMGDDIKWEDAYLYGGLSRHTYQKWIDHSQFQEELKQKIEYHKHDEEFQDYLVAVQRDQHSGMPFQEYRASRSR